MDTWRECERTGDALLDFEDETGETLTVRVPWEQRAHSLGWGRRRRARWKHATTGADLNGLIVSEGEAGVMARDETGQLHALPEGSYEPVDWPKGKPKPMAKATGGRVWVAEHQRGGSRVAGHWREVKPGQSFPAPDHLGGKAHVAETDDEGTATVQHESGARVKMPAASVPHYIHDLNETLPHDPTSGDKAIDGVLEGEGQRIGKGNDGIVYKSPTGEAVKISTTVPYQPHNPGHRTPRGAVAHLRNEHDAHRALADLDHVPEVRGQEHDGRYFLVKPWAPDAAQYTPDELASVEGTIRAMHERGWSLNDEVQLGRTADGDVVLTDLGQATDNAGPAQMKRDMERLTELFRGHGHNRELTGDALAKRHDELAAQARSGAEAHDDPKNAARYAEWEMLHEQRGAELMEGFDTDDDDEFARLLEQHDAHQTEGQEIRALWKQAAEDLRKAVLAVALLPLEKAQKHPEPPPGSRWITVHPHGPGTEGQPILITPEPDGTFRVIGGAGGSMNHLRLRDVASESEMKAKADARRKEKAAARRERRKAMTKEEREAEDAAEQAKKDRLRAAERKVIETVRDKRGGVDRDLTEDDLAGLSEPARKKLENQHHRKQLAQAMKQRKELAMALASERLEQLEDEAAVDATLREDADLWTEAQELGARELALIEAEEEARRANRTPAADRADRDERRAAAAQTATDVLAGLDREALDAELEDLGGRADPTGAMAAIIGETASEEQRRRAAVEKANAVILAEAASGAPPSDDMPRAELEFQVIAEALEAAGISPDATDEERQQALANEASIALQRAQLAEVKAAKFEGMEADGDADKAMKAMVHGDVLRGLTAEVRDATQRLGLRGDAKTPLRTAEVAEMIDVLSSFEALRDAKKGLDAVEAAEKKGPSYDKSRRAFELQMSEAPDHVIEQVQEQVLRELAQRIVGMADTKSPDHVRAVTDGHYAKMADISLAVANANYVDRTVVDALGLKNAGVLLRHALEADGHDADTLHNALTGHHVREQGKLTAAALRAADAYVPDIEETIRSVGDVEHAMRKLDAAEADIAAAQRAVGSALGQMESTATLAQTMRGKQPEHLTIELKDKGTSGLSGHLTWLASVGLGPDDYEIDTEAKEIRIGKDAWGKLIRKEDKGIVEARKLAHAIKRGEHDEDGWMPQGMVSRSSTSFTDPPADAPRYHHHLDMNADDIVTSLSDHVGSRLANGERPSDIANDLLSPQVAGQSADPESFSEMVRELFPITTEEDEAQKVENARIRRERQALTDDYNAARAEGDADRMAELATQIGALPKEKEVTEKRDTHFADHYEEIASGYLRRHHPDADSMHAASLYAPGVDEGQVRESVFRALASNPEHVAAFTPHGELTPAHRRALQDAFYKRAGIAETRDYSAEFGSRLDEAIADIKSGETKTAAVAPAGPGLFGGPAPAEQPSAKELTAETFGELHPEEAKALALEYPREGADLYRQAMGERPAEPTGPSRLDPSVKAAIDQIRERRPTAGPADLAKAAARQIGRERALKEAGLSEEDLRAVDPVTGELTPEARQAAGKIEVRAADLAQRGVNPEHIKAEYGHLIHDAELEEFERHRKKNATPWAQFVDFHGGLSSAYQALQEEMRGEFAGNLAEHYGKITGRGLATTISEIPNADLHAQALATPAERAELAKARREEVQKIRQGQRAAKGTRDASGKAVGGQYLTGSAIEAYKAAQDEQRSIQQRQGGLFGAAPPAPGKLHSGPEANRDPKAGERLALGRRIEDEVSALVSGNMGQTLDPKKPVRVFAGASMDGRRIHQQRVVKMLRHGNGRVGAWLGTGSGKTPTSIGGFTDLHADGLTTHGLFLVPTAVQSQFGEEMLSFTEPGKYKFETGEGKGHAERAALLRSQDTHMRVMTHQSATRTILRMAADHHGVAPEAMLERLRGQSDAERATTIREAMDAHGVPRHYTYIDEAHGMTTRQGEQESDMSIVIGALAHPTNSTHLLAGSATPHKNDTSEVHAMARLLDPDRYSDAYRFMQSYGVGSVAAPDAIRRELDQMTYTASIPPDGVQRRDVANPQIIDGQKVGGGALPMSDEHGQAVQAVTGAYEKAARAFREGGVDVEATKALNPERFKSAPDDKHEAIARELGPSLGIVKETAIRKALQLAPIEHNEKLRRMVDVLDHDVKNGKPSIVFTDSLEEAKHVHATLAAKGHAAGLYHGGLDNRERDAFRKGFADGQTKIAIMTSAGEAGINMQSGKVIHHYDVPKTMKSWSQRNGRAFRQGQKDDVDVHDWTHDHDFEHNAVRRLRDKAQLADVFQTPLGPLDEHGFARDYAEAINERHASFDIAAK